MASHGLGHRVAWQKGLDKGRLGIAACGNSAQENQVGKDQLGSEANFFYCKWFVLVVGRGNGVNCTQWKLSERDLK